MAAVHDTREVTRFSPRHLAFVVPLIVLHLACGAVFIVGTSRVAMQVLVITILAQMFGITIGYHRLLAHRSFKTSRPFQFILALLGTLAGQNGPLWWVGHHRHHHQYADQEDDLHSPRRGFLWSHVGWLFSPRCVPVQTGLVADLAQMGELRLLQQYGYVIPLGYAMLLYGLGDMWRRFDPAAGTSGLQLVIWGSVLSTVWVYHIVWCIGSIGHRYGTRPFPTRDDSRNNLFLSLLLLGDGWHNNHHYCPYSAKVGFRWWEFDINYALLRLLACVGIVWDLQLPPRQAITSGGKTPWQREYHS
jgi:stearoyl-CoA desaturase (delta-9 desaturase)